MADSYPSVGTAAKMKASHVFSLRLHIYRFFFLPSFKLTFLLQILQIFNHTLYAYKSWDTETLH